LLVARKPDDQKKSKPQDIDLWHKRLGHLDAKNVKKTAEITKGIKLTNANLPKSPCKACSIAKPLKYIRKVVSKRVSKPFDKIHVDTFMINPVRYNGHKYGLIFTDEDMYARWGYIFKEKSKVFIYVKHFTALVDTQYSFKIKAFRLDSSKEYSLSQLESFCVDLRAILEITTPYSAYQDGISECSIRLILEKVRTVMISMNIPAFL
jgi:hypothetical protein